MIKHKTNSRQKTVLQVIPALEIGGAERGTVEVARALVGEGWRALVISQGGRLVGDLEAAGAEHITAPMASKNPLQMGLNIRTLKRIIAQQQVDIVHARSRAPAWSAYFATRKAEKAGVSFVTTYQSIYSEAYPLKRLYNSVMARGDLTIANSDYTADLIRRRHENVAQKIEIVHRGVDLNEFSPQQVSENQLHSLRENWQLDRTKKVLLLPGRLAGRKGHRLLIEAVAKIDLGAVPPFVCVFAGDTAGREHVVDRLGKQIDGHGLGEDVFKFPGHCSDMAAAYLASDIVLMPSTVPEAFGRVAAEAQAMGKPVIVTDIGAVGETVRAQPDVEETEITGWRIAPDSPDALAQAIITALQVPQSELDLIGKRAVEFITQTYSIAKMTAATLKLYRELSELTQKQQ